MSDLRIMSTEEKIGEALLRSIPLLPGEAQEVVRQMLTPTSLAIVAGTLIGWAGSHFFGIGEIVDVILLVVGLATIGTGVYTGSKELYRFATTAIKAHTDADLDLAARHFATAVSILGITVISAILLKRSAKSIAARGRPQVRQMPNVGTPPPVGVPPRITRPLTLPGGALGETDAWGNIAVTRSQTLIEQRLTLYHEWVHSILSPKFAPLRLLRAQVRMSGYLRSSLLTYLEEAMAESYAQLRVHGLQNILVGIRFPIANGYVTISQLTSEGIAIGNIIIDGMHFTIYLQTGGVWNP